MTVLKTKILDTVKNNQIAMIPKWKFVAYSVLSIFGLLFIFLATVFVLSLIIFLLSRYGFLYMPFVDGMETLHMLRAIPVMLLFVTVAGLILLEVISRQYSFSFKKPLLVTAFTFTIIAMLLSFVLSETSMHEYVHAYAKDKHIKIVTRMYERPIPLKRGDGKDVLRGEVLVSSATATTIRLFNGSEMTVYISTSTTHPKKFLVPAIGDDVVIVGRFFNDAFQMIDIFPAPRMPFHGHRPRKNIPKINTATTASDAFLLMERQ